MANSRLCSIAGCGKPVRARGWCNPHWIRWSRYGDPTAGGTMRGELPRFYRDVVLKHEGDECLFWPYQKDGHGYGVMGDDGARKAVHRMVCEAVNGPPPTPKHEAAHSCGNGHLACVTKSHLSWKTRAENFADKLIHDTHNRGERNGSAKLTETKVRAIKKALHANMPQHRIAKAFKTSPANVSHIHCGDSWAWLD